MALPYQNNATTKSGVGSRSVSRHQRVCEFIAFSSFLHREINSVPITTETELEAPEIAQNLHIPASTEFTFGKTF